MATPDNVIATILQGIAISGLGLLAYETGYSWFKGIGSHEFDTKEVAQFTMVGFLFLTGALSEPIFQFFQSLALGLDMTQEIGVVAVASRLLVNSMVKRWRFDDGLSLMIYLGGLAAVFHQSLPVI